MSKLEPVCPLEEEYPKYNICKQKLGKYIIWLNKNKNISATLKENQRNAIKDLREYWNSYKKKDKVFVLALHKHHETVSGNSGNQTLWMEYLLSVVDLSKDLYKEIPQEQKEHKCSDENCTHDHANTNDLSSGLLKMGITKEDLSKVIKEMTKQYKEVFGTDPLNQQKKKYQREELIKLITDNYKFWLKGIPNKEETDYNGEDKAKAFLCSSSMKSLMDQANKLKLTTEVLKMINIK